MESCPFGVPLRSTSDALVYASGIAYFLNCTKSDFACLRAQSVEQILAAQAKAQKDPLVDPSLLEIFMPTTPHYGPGSEIPANLFASFQSGAAPLNVPLVMGVTHDESVPFIYGAFGKPMGKVEFELLLFAIFGSHAVEPLLDYYPAPANTTDYRELMTVIGTHAIFACPSRNASQAAAAGGATIYSYVYDHVTSFSANMWGKNFSFCFDKVCHGAELPFVFSPPDLAKFGDLMTRDEQSLAALMSQHWSSMAANAAPGPSWPQYTQQSSLQQMYFATPSVVVSDWLESTCNFWDQTIGWKWV
jgi:carboxylesterase type B